MMVCKQCGAHNSDRDTFCGSCGGFLEWTGERVKPAPAPVAEQEAEEPAPKKGFFARLESLLYADVGHRPPAGAATGSSSPGFGPPSMGSMGPPGGPPRPSGPPMGSLGPPGAEPPKKPKLAVGSLGPSPLGPPPGGPP
ncbi:MAG TPA: hypothetical protein VGD67_11675, partial [Pseudonocardiaceae bacterium]